MCSSKSLRGLGLSCALSAAAVSPVASGQSCANFPQATFPVQEGMTMVTQFGGFLNPQQIGGLLDPNGFSVVLVDTRDPACAGAVLGQNWCAPQFHNEFPLNSDSWTAGVAAGANAGDEHLGQVFGITHDDQVPPNFYVSATTVYGNFTGFQYQFGFGGSGAIYEIDGSTGAVSLFATVPNASGAALGNLVFDAATQRIYVTNFDDGLIYGIPVGVGLTVTYDHGAVGRLAESLAAIPDDPTQQFTPLGRRVWGIHVHEGRLYYSAYWEDAARQNPNQANEVWSVGLGGPSANPFQPGTAVREILIPPFSGIYSNPVSSIAFSSTGKMILAERVKHDDYGTAGFDAHSARVLEYELIGPTWTSTTNDFYVGNFSTQTNSTGGADYDCEGEVNCAPVATIENVWMTGDALNLSGGQAIYGLQRTPPTGNVLNQVALTSHWVDLDGSLTTLDKTQTGDLEVYCLLEPPCMEVEDVEVVCNPDDPSKVTVNATITNNSGVDAQWLLFTPQSPDSSQLMIMPNMMNQFIPDGGTTNISVTVMGINGFDNLTGEEICFSITILDETLEACCSEEVCFTPDCDCFQVIKDEITCDPAVPGCFTWTFEFVNLSQYTIHHIYFFPPVGAVIDTAEVVDNYLHLVPPVAPGANSGPITVTICFDSDLAPGTIVCIPMTIHDLGTHACCTGEHCIEIPDCDGDIKEGGCCLCDGTCINIPEEDCFQQGFYLGNGVFCGTPGVICQPPDLVFGACCFPDHCIEGVFLCECNAAGGVFLGPGSSCLECAFVPTEVLCCRPNGFCQFMLSTDCEAIGGVSLPLPGDCDQCPNHIGACCLPTGTCVQIAQAPCVAQGGNWLGVNTQCSQCPVPLDGDCNTDGCVDSTDLNILLAQFGSAGPQADLNDDGVVNSVDLNILLANFGQGDR